MPGVPATWEQTLDAIEAQLDAADAALEGSTLPTLDEFEPPTVTGPIPEALAERAHAVRDRSDALQRRLEADSARIRAQLVQLPRFQPGRGTARFEVEA